MKSTRRLFVGSGFGFGLLASAGIKAGPGNLGSLAGRFQGDLITPASSRYAELTRRFVSSPRFPARPQLIALCASEMDVVRALAFARENSLEVAVRSGGHDLQAASIGNGLVIDLSRLQSIAFDDASRQVRVGGGVRAGALNRTLADRGHAVALGCANQVGVAGLTLGGGLGWLAGKIGAACDHLVGARVATADGPLLQVTADSHSDLLWALRGGGGNFGVVTELTLQAHPLAHVTSGIVALKATDFAGFLRRHREYLSGAGDDVDLETFVLPTIAGPTIFIKACYSGEAAHAERVLAPLRKLGDYVADDLAPRRYTGSIDPTGAVVPLFASTPAMKAAGDLPGLHVGSVSMAPVSDAAAVVLAEQIARGVGNWAAGVAHLIHGAAARAGLDHSPMPRIPGLLTTYVLTSWRRAEAAEPAMRWIDETIRQLRPYARPTYLNYLTDGAPDAVRAAYGPAFNRLRDVKRRFDPDNVFRRGRNIPPAD